MKVRRYSLEEKQFLIDITPNSTHSEIIRRFNAHFKEPLTKRNLIVFLSNNRVYTKHKRHFDEDEIQFLRETIPGKSRTDTIRLFNATFREPITANQLKGFMGKYKVYTGIDPRIKKGESRSPQTQFKKGTIPPSWKPVGSISILRGYQVQKIGEPGIWRKMHELVWEAANGPIPADHIIIFGDGNTMNINIENLLCVSRAELAVMMSHGFYSLKNKDVNFTRLYKMFADLKIKIREKERERE